MTPDEVDAYRRALQKTKDTLGDGWPDSMVFTAQDVADLLEEIDHLHALHQDAAREVARVELLAGQVLEELDRLRAENATLRQDQGGGRQQIDEEC